MTKASEIYFPVGGVEQAMIKSIWRLREWDTSPRSEIILPKGTVEIIFNFSDPITYINPSPHLTRQLPVVFINGLNFKPFELVKSGQQEFLGIQLSTIGLRLLFNVSVKEFNNNVCEGALICRSLEALSQELFSETSFQGKVEVITKWIHHKVSGKQLDKGLDRIQKLIHLQSSGDLTVRRIIHEICLSDRQLRRLSSDWLGMSTEAFILYKKYLAALHLLHTPGLSLTQIGLQAGYYDQSHFIREFKSYTDRTPGQYQQSFKDLPGHIFI
jgi:AraC-like DNA-binding protein